MINEDVSEKTLRMQVDAGKKLARETLRLIDKLVKELLKRGVSLDKYLQGNGNEVKLKDLVKKGQLEEIPVKDSDLKELKKELGRHGVRFSVMKDKENGNYSVFFQSKDLAVMEKAFKNALAATEKKEAKKESVVEKINQFRDAVKDVVNKDKVKNKQKEQSL